MIPEKESNTIRYRVVYSARRTLAISILPDASVIIRAPYRTSESRIRKLVSDKADWILKHTNNFRIANSKKEQLTYTDGSVHPFLGNQIKLTIEKSDRSWYKYKDGVLSIGLSVAEQPEIVKAIIDRFYKNQAMVIFPEVLRKIVNRFENYGLRPSELKVRTMKRRWGSCSSRGTITLNSELMRFPEKYLESVIIHELCHLKHHNHGEGFYRLLTELDPEWKIRRKEMKGFLLG